MLALEKRQGRSKASPEIHVMRRQSEETDVRRLNRHKATEQTQGKGRSNAAERTERRRRRSGDANKIATELLPKTITKTVANVTNVRQSTKRIRVDRKSNENSEKREG